MTLDELAKINGTDKSSDIHNYCHVYEDFFCRIKNKPIKLLEIEVFKGNSLRMWRDYFPQAQIVGIDNQREHNDCLSSNEERIKVLIGNQSDNQFLSNVSELGPFDIIIDDESHVWSDIITSYEYLIQKLSSGGFYCIEDLHTSYNCLYRGTAQTSTVNYLKNLIDNIQLFGVGGSIRGNHNASVKWQEPDTTHFNNKLIESAHFFPSLCVLKKK